MNANLANANTRGDQERGVDNTMAKNGINPLPQNCVVFLLLTEGVVVFPNFAKICLNEGMIICGRGEWNPPILIMTYYVKRGFLAQKC